MAGGWRMNRTRAADSTQVYVRPFPNVEGGKWLVSNGGGTTPLWARRGGTLFFRGSDGAIMAAAVETSGTNFRSGQAVKAANAYYTGGGAFVARTYDVSPDDTKFLVIKDATDTLVHPHIVVVQNWLEELKARVPIK